MFCSNLHIEVIGGVVYKLKILQKLQVKCARAKY